ncbi:MAG TPA: molecular chaperone DnaJ [Nostocaceae cyanobacterium]|nr:molecular chaperone DnaJ [Nostocaceae cyanobacterium]
MPRKTVSASPKQSAALSLSDLHIHLEVLEKEHQSLLKNIKKKRTELNNFVEKMRTLATDIFHRVSPKLKEMVELDQEIHSLFAEIFTTRKFGKQSKKNIEGIYYQLQLSGIISPKSHREDQDTELDELFEDLPPRNHDEQEHHGFHQQQQDLESATRPKNDESRKIRQTFLQLAEIFHPDKVKDNETQKSHTEIMKEINKAYQEGDLARLLEIERQYQVGESIDISSENDLQRKCKKLEQQNEILKNQYENLKQELRLAKNTPEGAMVSDARKASKEGIDYIGLMLKTVESQVEVIAEIRNFVKDFRDKKITIQEFTAGPAILKSLSRKLMEDMLEELSEELDGVIFF